MASKTDFDSITENIWNDIQPGLVVSKVPIAIYMMVSLPVGNQLL